MPATRPAFLDTLDTLPELRPFPEVATRLLALVQDDNSTAAELTSTILSDAAIATRLLHLANSPMFGFQGEICTIDHAIVILGRRQVSNFAVSLAAGEVFATGNTAHQARTALWSHSLGCAAVARALARTTSEWQPDEVFLAAIMHDVGKLVFFDLLADEYLDLMDRTQGHCAVTVENHEYGISHQEVGQRCAEQWGLPWEIADVICDHHLSEDRDFSSGVSALVAAANMLSKSWGLGTQPARPFDEPEVLARCGLTIDPDVLGDLRLVAESEFQTLCQSCRP